MLEIDLRLKHVKPQQGSQSVFKSKVAVLSICKEGTKRCAHPTIWDLEAAKIPHFWVPKFQ